MIHSQFVEKCIRLSIEKFAHQNMRFSWFRNTKNISQFPALKLTCENWSRNPFGYQPETGFYKGRLIFFSHINDQEKTHVLCQQIWDFMCRDSVSLELDRAFIEIAFSNESIKIHNEEKNSHYPEILSFCFDSYINYYEEGAYVE